MLSTARSTLSLPLSSFTQRAKSDLPLPVLKIISYQAPKQSSAATHEIVDSLEPIIHTLDTRVLWFAPANNDMQRKDLSFSFYPLNPQPGLLRAASNFHTEHLHPLFHGLRLEKALDPNDWKAFRQLSEVVAASTLAVSSQSFPILFWLHDYQLALTAPLLAMHAGTILAYFWQAPWPEPELLSQSPIIEEFVHALLSNNVLAFQSKQYAKNYLKTVELFAPKAQIDWKNLEVYSGRHQTKIKVMPLGIDWSRWQKLAHKAQKNADELKEKFKPKGQIILNIDRIDPSRGILEKLTALDHFLSTNTDQLSKLHYVQFLYEAGLNNNANAIHTSCIKTTIENINTKYAQGNWRPITLIEGKLEADELAAWYQVADILILNQTVEGFGLIEKEFIASNINENGILILSDKCGSADELAEGAFLVNPLRQEELALALNKSLKMTKEKRNIRMAKLREIVSGNQLQDWALGLLYEALSTSNYK